MGLVIAADCFRCFSGKIYIISNVHVAGEEPEADMYVEALKKLRVFRVDEKDIIVIREAQETVGQLKKAWAIAQEKKLELVIVSTFLHFPRVYWICLKDGIKAQHYIALGMPRPGEALRDIALWFIFPIIDLTGQRERFLKYVEERRLRGIH